MTQGHAMNKCWENGPNRLASGRAATNLELVRQALSVVPSKVRRASAASAAVLRLLVAFFIHTHTHTQSLTLNLNLLVSSSFLYWAWSILWYRFLFFCSSSTACFLGAEAVGQDAGLESRTWVLFPSPARLAVRLHKSLPLSGLMLVPRGHPGRDCCSVPGHRSCRPAGLISIYLPIQSYPWSSDLPSSEHVSTLGRCPAPLQCSVCM